MKTKKIISILTGVATTLTIVGFALYAKKNQPVQKIEYNPAFNAYISGYTSWEVSRQAPIQVRFIDEQVKKNKVNKQLKKLPFTFKPAINGTATWIDTRTIEFTPKKSLPEATNFQAFLDLSDIVKKIPDSLKTFAFEFRTKKQTIDLEVYGMQQQAADDIVNQKLTGTFVTNDYEKPTVIENIVKAKFENKNLPITWKHNPVNNTHSFEVSGIKRQGAEGAVLLEWNGEQYGISRSAGSQTIKIPSIHEFKIVNVTASSSPDQLVIIEFSDPLKHDQVLTGLVTLAKTSCKFVIDNNKIFCYPIKRTLGEVAVSIDPNVVNGLGFPLGESYSSTIVFEDIKPQINLVGKGTIIPQGDVLPFSFSAVNLSHVDLKVLKIQEKNIPQFLQVNRLSGTNQLRRVGETMAVERVKLNDKLDLKTWNEHTIDLSNYIKTEPGAIYQVSLGFRHSYSLFHCSEEVDKIWDTDMFNGAGKKKEVDMTDEEYWAQYENHHYGYNYEDRQNPCKPAYYRSGKVRSRNILASSIGLITKTGKDGSIHVIATDLKTTNPLQGAKIQILNYSNRVLKSLTTDAQGFAKTSLEGTPYLIMASYGKNRGYLKIDYGNNLSLSNFDVSGNTYEKGLKGFIYGERGVWRPGDSLFLNFILEDKAKSLPQNHPVSFEFTNPKGQLVAREIQRKSVNGFYAFHTKTNSSAPTGNYQLKVRVGGNTFHKTIKVETIRPNRLKMRIDFPEENIVAGKPDQTATLVSHWLHGAEASNLKANVAVAMTKSHTSFKGYEGYQFEHPNARFHFERKVIFENNLDEHGQAKIPTDIGLNQYVPGKLTASFKVKVYEAGGNFSVDQFSKSYYPYEVYAGIKPENPQRYGYLHTGTENSISIVSVDYNGKPKPGRKIQAKLFKIGYRWWYDSYDGAFNYNGRNYETFVKEVTLTTDANGKAQFNFQVDKQDWGQYIIRVKEEGGHVSGRRFYVDWPGYYGRSEAENPMGSKMLSFSTDKKKYETGESVTVHLPTAQAGRMLVSIENGTKVVKKFWHSAVTGENKITFKTTSEMAPNCFVHIALIQPHAQTINDLPIRMYGVVPIEVHNPKSHLHPIISMPDKLEPEQKVLIKVSEKNNQPMTFTLAVVDEGLLNITRHRTPDVWAEFNKRQALGVKTFDLFDHVAGAQKIDLKNLLSVGGDGANKSGEGAKANRFKPVVKFFGPIKLNAGETKNIHFTMPNYVGSVKTVLIAAQDGAYGSTEKVTPVKKPLMVIGTMPRVLSPGEEVYFPVTIFAMEDHIKNVTASVETNEFFELLGPKSQTVTFDRVGEKVISFPLKVKEKVGIGRVKAIVSAGSEKASYPVELDIRNPNPMVTDVYTQVISEGESWNKSLSPVGIIGTNTGRIEISSVPPLNLGRRLNYLIRYPYGCIEQTTSSVFPQLYLAQLMDLTPLQKREVNQYVNAGIERLSSFQLGSGGLTYWPGDYDVHSWGSNYAGHFLLEAKEAGYFVPKRVLKNWGKYQAKQAKSWNKNQSEIDQAYRLYLLAKAGKPELGAMNRFKSIKSKRTVSSWYLAGAYFYAGQKTVANDLVSRLTTDIVEYRELGGSFGSSTRDRAVILEILSLMDKKTKAAEMAILISKQLNSNQWMSTQTTAYSLIAMAKFIGKDGLEKTPKFKITTSDMSPVQIIAQKPVWQQSFPMDRNKDQKIEISNSSKGPLYVQIINEGQPLAGEETDASNGMALNIQYFDMDGLNLDINELTQGTEFYAQITMTNTGLSENYEEMAITKIFPSGWEIHNPRMDITLQANSGVDYEDFRDDRVNIFYDIRHGKMKTVKVYLTASYLGKFYLPATVTEAMYDHTINARKKGHWVQVKQKEKI